MTGNCHGGDSNPAGHKSDTKQKYNVYVNSKGRRAFRFVATYTGEAADNTRSPRGAQAPRRDITRAARLCAHPENPDRGFDYQERGVAIAVDFVGV